MSGLNTRAARRRHTATQKRSTPVSARQDGWGMVLVFFILTFLIGLTLVVVRSQLTNTRDLRSHDAAHDEYWRANAFATDIEASLRSDFLDAYQAEAAQARSKELELNAKSRLPVFDEAGEANSRPLVTFSPPTANWFAGPGAALQVPAGQHTGRTPGECSSLLGSFAGWLAAHRELPHIFARLAPRNWRVPADGRLASLELAYRDAQQTSDNGYPQIIYVLDFVIEAGTGADDEHALVRKSGRITIGAWSGQVCPPPRILRVTRLGEPAPVEAGQPLIFTWETDGAEEMSIQTISPSGQFGPLIAVSLLQNPLGQYVQTKRWGDDPFEGQIIASIEDQNQAEEILSVRFVATSRCGANASLASVVPVRIKQTRLEGWSSPPFPGLRERRNNNADKMGFFYSWAEARGASAGKIEITLRVGYTMGEQNASRQSNGAPVRNSLIGAVTSIRSVAAQGGLQQVLAQNISISPNSTVPGMARTFATRYMASPQRGCESPKCRGQAPGTVNMTMQFQWQIDKPTAEAAGYIINWRINATTIDMLRAQHNDIYARNAARNGDEPWMTGVIFLRPTAAPTNNTLPPPGGFDPPPQKEPPFTVPDEPPPNGGTWKPIRRGVPNDPGPRGPAFN